MDGSGNFVITWTDQLAKRPIERLCQGFTANAAGTPQGNSSSWSGTLATAGDQENATVAMAANGNFVLTWSGNQAGHWKTSRMPGGFLADGGSRGQAPPAPSSSNR